MMTTLSRSLALTVLLGACTSENVISSLASATLLRDGVDNDADGLIDETDEGTIADTGGSTDDMRDGCERGDGAPADDHTDRPTDAPRHGRGHRR